MKDDREAATIERVVQFRVKHHLSQAKTAELLGVHVNTIINIENGHYTPRRLTAETIKQKIEEYERGNKNVM